MSRLMMSPQQLPSVRDIFKATSTSAPEPPRDILNDPPSTKLSLPVQKMTESVIGIPTPANQPQQNLMPISSTVSSSTTSLLPSIVQTPIQPSLGPVIGHSMGNQYIPRSVPGKIPVNSANPLPTSTSAGTTPKVPVFHNDALPERRLTEPTIPSMSLFSQPGQTPFSSGPTSHPVQEGLQQRSNSLEAKPRGSIDSLPSPKLVTYMQPPQPAHASPSLSNPGPPPAQVIVYPQQQGPSLGPPPVTSSTKPVEAPMLVTGPTVPYGSQPISQQVALAGNPPPPPPPPPQQAEFYYASNPSNASQSQHYSKYYYSLNPITGEPIGVTAIPIGPTTGMIQSYPGGVPSGVAPMQPQPQVQAQNPPPPPPPQLGHGYSQQVGSTPGSAAYLGPPPGTHPNGYPMFHYGFHYMGMYDPNSVGTYGFDQNNALMNKRRIIKRRTRTGCLTCRRRRIKCDERKPECYNCERSGKVCLGYEIVDPLNMRRRNTVANGSLPSNSSENEESRIKKEEKSQPGSPKKLELEKDHQHDQDHDSQGTTIKDRNNAKLLSVSNLLSQ